MNLGFEDGQEAGFAELLVVFGSDYKSARGMTDRARCRRHLQNVQKLLRYHGTMEMKLLSRQLRFIRHSRKSTGTLRNSK